MAIPNHRIRDLKTFEEVTKEPHQVAGLYFFSMLDCLVDLAYEISHDFFGRPHLYTNLSNSSNPAVDLKDTIAPILAKLHARYGSDEKVLAKSQRDSIYFALFGKRVVSSKEDESNFSHLRDDLVNACAAFSERVFDTGEAMLRERVREAHRLFHEYLTGLLGDSVRWSRQQALAELTEATSYTIIRNKGVAAVFGISTVPTKDWPYVFDSNADKLVEQISMKLMASGKAEERAMIDKHTYLTREYISNLQRAALRGAEAIATIIDFDEGGNNDDLDVLITKCYTWGASLVSLSGRTTSVELNHAETPREVIPVQPLAPVEPAPASNGRQPALNQPLATTEPPPSEDRRQPMVNRSLLPRERIR